MGNGQVVSHILEYSGESTPAYHGPDGKTALHAAVLRNDRGITRMLAKKLKDITKEADWSGLIPLHYAAKKGFLRTVVVLLQEDASAAYIGDEDHNMTALHFAAKYRRVHSMKEIMSRCPHSCEQVDKIGRNLLHFVVEGNSKDALLFALSNPFVKLNLVNGEDNQGNRPLDKLPTTFNFLSLFDKNFGWIPSSKAPQIWVKGWEIFDRAKHEDDDIDPKRSGGEETERLLKDRGNNLLVATLIATVTFAAAFTMPGGYLTDKGTPVLIKSTAFKVFIVSDIASLMLSSFAVLIHFRFQLFEMEKRIMPGLVIAIRATFLALMMMLVAFSAGAYAVLSPSRSWLATLCYVLPIALAYIVGMYVECLVKSPSLFFAVGEI